VSFVPHFPENEIATGNPAGYRLAVFALLNNTTTTIYPDRFV
jgi:hypothetical protein